MALQYFIILLTNKLWHSVSLDRQSYRLNIFVSQCKQSGFKKMHNHNREKKNCTVMGKRNQINEDIYLMQCCSSAPVSGISELRTDPCCLRAQIANKKLITGIFTNLQEKKGANNQQVQLISFTTLIANRSKHPTSQLAVNIS